MADPKVQHIFCPCSFTYENRGDALLLLSLDHALKKRFGSEIRLTFSSFDPIRDSVHYGATVGPEPLRMTFKGAGLLRLVIGRTWPVLMVILAWVFVGAMAVLIRLFRRSPRLTRIPLPQSWRYVLEQSLSADLIIAVPGGYLMAPSRASWAWLCHFCTLAVGILAGKLVILSPCSVGPFHPIYRTAARWLLQRIDLLVLREEESLQFLQPLNIDEKKIRIAPDMSFAYSTLSRSKPQREKRGIKIGHEKPVIGISVRRHFFPGAAQPDVLWDTYLNSVATAVDWLVQTLNAEIVFVPQCTGRGGDDPGVARLVAERCQTSENISIIDHVGSISELFSLYSGFDLMLGTRMHANLIALNLGVPVVAIAYEPKTTGIMNHLELSRYVIDIKQITPQEITTRLQEAWARRESLRDHTNSRVIKEQQRSLDWLDEIHLNGKSGSIGISTVERHERVTGAIRV